MALRRYVVRRHVGNSNRTVVLPARGGAPSPRRGVYDDYDRPSEPRRVEASTAGARLGLAAAGPVPVPLVHVQRYCRACGEPRARYNTLRRFFYPHDRHGGGAGRCAGPEGARRG